jgi:DNA-binding PadR family transcriptional regulator
MKLAEHPGHFEQLILLATARLSPDAYGLSIREDISARTGRDVSVGAVYATLERLEQKGMVASRLGDPTPERGGRAKRLFALTPAGASALRACRNAQKRMWAGLKLRAWKASKS